MKTIDLAFMSTGPSTTVAREPDALSLQAFTVCWCACLVISKFSRSAVDTPWAALATALAVACLVNSRCSTLLLLAAIARLVEYVDDLPDTTQHFYLNASFSLAVVFGYLTSVARERRFVVTQAGLFSSFVVSARLIAFVCLFWSGLSKVNADFLNEKLSCASELYDYQRYYFPALPESRWMRSLAPYIAIGGELGSALLILFPRTRTLGVWIGLAFMLTVGLNPHNRVFVFAGPVIAALLTFVPGEVWGDLIATPLGSRLSAWTGTRFFRWAVPSVLAVVAVYGEPGAALRDLRHAAIVVSFYVAAPVLLSSIAWLWWKRNSKRSTPVRRLFAGTSHWAIGMATVLFAHQALMTVGIYSRTHYNMASNFLVSPAYSNHYLFVPSTWGWNDPIRVLDSSSKTVRKSGSGAAGLPWIYFSDLVARHPRTWVKFVRDGKVVRVRRRNHAESFQRSWYAWAFPARSVPLREFHPRCHHVAPQNR